jgi:hypothetical protein
MDPGAFCFMQPHFPPLLARALVSRRVVARCDSYFINAVAREYSACLNLIDVMVLAHCGFNASPRTNCSSMSSSIHSGCSPPN